MNVASVVHKGLVQFNKEVKEGVFPAKENCTYKVPEEELEQMKRLLEKVSKSAGVDLKGLEEETTKLY